MDLCRGLTGRLGGEGAGGSGCFVRGLGFTEGGAADGLLAEEAAPSCFCSFSLSVVRLLATGEQGFAGGDGFLDWWGGESGCFPFCICGTFS